MIFSNRGSLKRNSRVTRCENSKSRTTQLSPITPHAANLVPITHHADNLGPITRHGKSLCTITIGDQIKMKICYNMIYWHGSRHWQRYYDVIIYLLALIRIYPSLGVLLPQSRFREQFSSNTCPNIREVWAKSMSAFSRHFSRWIFYGSKQS